MKEQMLFSKGDWIVHVHHGVGQVRQKSSKRIGQHEGEYYQVDLQSSTLWVPVDNVDPATFRTIASEEEFDEAMDLLRRPAREMGSDFSKRKSRIRSVQSEHSFVALARLVRDLWARQQERSLSNTEESALRQLSERLLSEWSICMQIEVDEAQQMLYRLLREGYPEKFAAD